MSKYGSKISLLLREKNIHLFFELSLWLKALFALFEMIAGFIAFAATKQVLLHFVDWVTKAEFAEDPKDVIATYVLHAVQNLSSSTQDFAGFYLLAHGIIKLWLIIGLLMKKLWYYPVAMIVFGLFIVYQVYRYTLTHSPWLLLITLLDVIVIWLTQHEYKLLKKVLG